jgi:hypothetical protein
MPRIVSRLRDYRAESVRIRRMKMNRRRYRDKDQLHRLGREMSNVSR